MTLPALAHTPAGEPVTSLEDHKGLIRRDDPRADFWADQVDERFNDILRLLTEAPEGDGELPPLLEEELRKAGLA